MDIETIMKTTNTMINSDPIINKTQAGIKLKEEIERITTNDFSKIVSDVIATKSITVIPESSILSSHTMAHLVRFIRKAMGASTKETSDQQTIDNIISDETNQALYYICGFILRKLKGDRWDPETLDVINEWGVPGENLPSQWTQLQDRGGLVGVSKEFFDIVQSMYKMTASTLSSIKSNCSLNDLLMESMIAQDYFSMLCDKFGFDLLYKSALYFTKVRCKAWVKATKTSTVSASLRQDMMGKTKKK